ncbi:Bug family tripartite tricarboxylate transporter substrate binding protein [Caenimonas koreensis]|uniref:Twin-arginine translocation pathway signal protein n=1 Tax=Caenimonas koreensis DSM 17982 TaxID=1121255 RepID=A0A844AXN8_9BURK|nr:Bug family tripartite tricarboxylate transporter substrate binding protein [Caenimonas koreensis]MRD49135.1 twin-arginine translocation pathway signal protein [Caenimonas koreensis DSM 17982]
MSNRREFVKQTAALATLGLPFTAGAQTSLDLARILCGFPPGGTSDAMSRRLADKLRGNYASNVLVENKPGAGGQIAITQLKDSPADGSTLLLTPSSMLSIYPYVYKTLPYKPLEDVQPASLACYFNHAFGVGPAVPESVKTVKDFLAWAKANPEKANYGSPGAGSMPHLIVALLNKLTGSDLKHIPYRGSAPGIQDLLGGQISAMSSPVGDYLPYIKTGKLRVLAISGQNRSPFVPEVATYRQQGYPITVREWYGVFLPGKARPEVVRRAAAYLQPALAQNDVITSMAQFGMEVQSSSPQVLGDLLRADAEEWRRLIKQIGFTPES